MSHLTVLSIFLLCPLFISTSPIPQTFLPSPNGQTMQSYWFQHKKHLTLHLIFEKLFMFLHYLQNSQPCQSGIPTANCKSSKVSKEQKAINMSQPNPNQKPGKNP